jgi:hypothetical protein
METGQKTGSTPELVHNKNYPASRYWYWYGTLSGHSPEIPVNRLHDPLVCLLLAGGTAFEKNVFYGIVFTGMALVLIFAGVHLGKQDPCSD